MDDDGGGDRRRRVVVLARLLRQYELGELVHRPADGRGGHGVQDARVQALEEAARTGHGVDLGWRKRNNVSQRLEMIAGIKECTFT